MRATPNDALVQLLKASGEWDDLVSGKGLRFTPARQVGPTPPPAQPFRIPPWDHPNQASSYIPPAPKPAVATEEVDGQRQPIDVGKLPTPRLDEVKQWQAEQLKAAKP